MKNNKEELQKQAKKLQKDLDDLKKLIEKEDTIDLFSIKTYEEVCKALNEKELTFNNFVKFDGSIEDNEKLLAFAQLKQIERLYNKNWVKDWNNNSQYKWYPYFTYSGGSLVFCGSRDDYAYFYGLVGFFKDKQTSNHVGKTFIEIYKKLM